MKTAKPDLDLRVDRALELPMYLQICRRFKTAIEQGNLRAGDRVPAVRALATELNLARDGGNGLSHPDGRGISAGQGRGRHRGVAVSAAASGPQAARQHGRTSQC